MTMTITELEPTMQEAIPGFDEASFTAQSTSHESQVLRIKREAAFQAYGGLPAPTVRDEAWRKTDPAQFPFGAVRILPQAKSTETVGDSEAWDDQFDVVVAVKDQVMSIDDRSGLLAKNAIQVMSLDDAAETCPALVEKHLQGAALPPNAEKFTALNSAFWNVGLFVHIPARMKLEKGILLRIEQTEDNVVLLPRILVIAGEQSEATMVEHYRSDDKVTMASVNAKELYVAEGARFRFLTLQEWGANSYQIEHDMAIVQRDAQVDWIALNLGSKVSKLQFGSDVAGEGSSAELDGVFFHRW